MSLRGIFSRQPESRRRKKASASYSMAVQTEHLEDRALLSSVSPFLNTHGLAFNNGHVQPGQTGVTFAAFNVPSGQLSNNPAGQGLNVVLNGAGFADADGDGFAGDGFVNTITLSQLMVNNNGNTGSVLNLFNMDIGRLIVDQCQFAGNGFDGLYIALNNVRIDQLIIINNSFTGNPLDGLSIAANDSRIDNFAIQGNVVQGNAQGDGISVLLSRTPVTNFAILGNQILNNGGSGLRVRLDNSPVTTLTMNANTVSSNGANGVFFDVLDSDVRGTITNNTIEGSLNLNGNSGNGLFFNTRRTLLPDGTIAPGFRNLDFDLVRGNVFRDNQGSGVSIDLRQNTTFDGTFTANSITGNQRVGLNIQAQDTTDAFDVQIGGTTLDSNNNNTDLNVIDGNRGAGIAVTLDDTSSVVGNTSGRFRILNNQISNSLNDNNVLTGFAGEGVFVRARGSVALVNGAARLLNSRINGNNITGNQSHGLAFDISEDSEVIDLLIGDEDGDGFVFQGGFVRNSGNVFQGNGGSGLNFLRRDAALARDVRIIDNLFQDNADGINYTARNLDNVVNTATINDNDSINNNVNGIVIQTQVDAILIVDMDNNFINSNAVDGIQTRGFEGDATDAETLGGVWTQNTIQGNGRKGININGVPGVVNPLVIGLLGVDGQGRSLGNLVTRNGDDGIEINAPGFIDLINNVITENGLNNTTLDVHGDGKGIDINLNDNDAGFNTNGGLTAYLGFNVIQSNFGDGLEIVSRGNFAVSTLVEVLAYGNIIDLNLGRGVDVLNAGTSDTYLVFGDGTTGDGSNRNIIRSNGLEAFYTVNTSSINQRQDVDATVTPIADTTGNALTGFAPNLTLDINGNEIQDNGLPGNFGQLNGSGLIIRVGTSASVTSPFAIPDRDGVSDFGGFVSVNGVGANNSAIFGNGRVNARVNNNTFGGNLGVDVLAESFNSTADPPATPGTWNATKFQINNGYRRDPLARLNLEMTNNTGNSVDLVRVGAFYDNAEGDFKSRTGGRTAPDPNGPFGNSAGRFRNAQRLADRGGFYVAPTTGSGGVFTGFGGTAAGTISNIIPGSGNTPIRVQTAARNGFIVNATNATPIVITSNNHGLTSFEEVEIVGVTGNTAANGIFTITVIDADTFSLNGSVGNGAYTGGGTWQVVITGTIDNVSGNGISPIVITDIFHGLATGAQITITGVTGNTAANGTFTITVIDQFTFSLDGTTGNGDYTGGGTYVATSSGHGLTTGTQVIIDTGSFGFGEGFVLDGIYDITVTTPNEFVLNDTEGESDIFFFFGGTYTEVSGNAFLYDGIGGSTFRIVDGGNSFNQGSDLGSSIFRGGGGTGHESYTYDVENPGTFNFRTIAVSEAVATEGNEASFTITLSEPLATDLNVFYTTDFDGTASDGINSPLAADFTPESNIVVIPAGMTTATVLIDTIADSTFESNETFKLLILSASTTITDLVTGNTITENFASPIDPFGIGTILDNDTIPLVSISDAGGFEVGGGGVGTIVFTVTLSNPSSEPVFVDFRTSDGTSNVDQDYRFRDGTVTFAPGETTGTITVEVLSDNFVEPQETFFVNLSSVQGAVFADAQAVGTIFDARFVNVTDAAVNGEGAGATTATFTVTLSQPVPVGQTLTVNFQTVDGTATAVSGDYVAQAGALTFLEGEVLRTINVTVNREMNIEGDEQFTVQLSSNNGTIQKGTGVGRILESLEVYGADAGGAPQVRVFDSRTGVERFSVLAYPAGFTGGVRVANGDINGDGIEDIVVAPGAGAISHVRVLNGIDGSSLRELVVFDASFTGGIYLATGDIDGDLRDDIIIGQGEGGSEVKVFSGLNGTLIRHYFNVYPGGFGVRVASGDVNGNGRDDIITGAGPGGGAHVRVLDGITSTNSSQTIRSFFFDSAAVMSGGPFFTGGIYVSAADFNGDLMADIIVGAGPGIASLVRVFSGADPSILLEELTPFGGFAGGTRVAAGDVSNMAGPEVIAAAGPGGGPHVLAFSINPAVGDQPDLSVIGPGGGGIFPFPTSFTGGLFVSGRSRGLASVGSPLLLDPSATPLAEDFGPVLTQADLQPVVEAALDRLRSAGVDDYRLWELGRIEFIVTDLDGSMLGLQTGNQILLDRNAAGLGWFVDSTPGQDEEFANVNGALIAQNADAQGRVDLLSVILHELRHALGEDHADGNVAPHHVLAPTILPGERRLPEQDAVFASGDIFESLLHLN